MKARNTERDRDIVARIASHGQTAQQVADAYGITAARVYQIVYRHQDNPWPIQRSRRRR